MSETENDNVCLQDTVSNKNSSSIERRVENYEDKAESESQIRDIFESSEEDESQDNDQTNRYWPPPIDDTVNVLASSGCKTVSALAINKAGTRFAAGGLDYEVRIWDFSAIEWDKPQPISCVQPCGTSIIKQLDFSNDDELLLVISGNCQATVLSRDGSGKNQATCPKGDQYLVDMNKTKGHVQMLNDGCWNPKDNNEFLTCSNDATLRLWDLNKMSQQKTVIKTRSPVNGLKAVPNVCKYSRDASSIIAGCNDGSIMVWDTRRKYFSTSNCIRNAHLKGSEMTGIDYCYASSSKIVSRSEDESCKLWDLRQLKQPLAARTGLATLQQAQDCCFSPDDKFVLIGTSPHSKDEPGQLLFLDSGDLVSKCAVEVASASVLRVLWHAKINHIAYSCSDGQVRLAYDRRRSMGGFLQPTDGRGTKRKKYKPSGGLNVSASIKKIITPHALPLFRDDQSCGAAASRRTATGGRGDLKRAYRPEMPTSSSADGRVKPAGSTLSSYIARNIAKPLDDGSTNTRDRHE